MSNLHICYPFGPSIQCSCHARGHPVTCIPVKDFNIDFGKGGNGAQGYGDAQGHGHGHGGVDVWNPGRQDQDVFEKDYDYKQLETKAVLAFTLLVLILLTFVG